MGQLVFDAIPVGGIGRRILADIDHRPLQAELGIERDEFFLAGGHVIFGKDRICRAFGLTQSAIDAFLGVDDQKIGPFVETVYRADIDTVGIFALDTVFGNYVCHGIFEYSLMF